MKSIHARVTNKFLVTRYDNSTGTFTVPPGGDGFYYFSTYFLAREGQYSGFDLVLNGDTLLCTAYADQRNSTNNDGPTSCNAIADAVAGDYIIKPINRNSIKKICQ